jgi:hypothetical protein
LGFLRKKDENRNNDANTGVRSLGAGVQVSVKERTKERKKMTVLGCN